MKGFSLKQIWTALVLFAVLVPVLLVMVWYGVSTYKNQVNNALNLEHQVNISLSKQLESEIYRIKTLLKNKSDPLLYLVDRAEEHEALKQINNLLWLITSREVVIHEVMVLSLAREVIAAKDRTIGMADNRLLTAEELQLVEAHSGLNLTYEPPEIVIPMAGRVYVGAPKQHTDTYTFTVAVPIGKPAKAVLVALVDFNQLWSANKEHRVGFDKAQDYLLDRRGSLVTNVAGSKYKIGDLMTHMEIVRASLVGDDWSAYTSYSGITGHPVYGTITKVPSLNWALVSEVIISKITQPIWMSLFGLFIWTLLGVAVFIWVVMRLAGRTLSPIQQVSHAIEKVTRGDFQLTLGSSGIRELDVMSTGFNKMVEARKKAESELSTEKDRIQITLESIGDAVIATNRECRVEYMNPSAEQLTGWRENKAIGQPLEKVFFIIDEATGKAAKNPAARCMKKGRIIGLTNHTGLVHRDGRIISIEDSAAPIRHEGGEITGAVLVFRDVTQTRSMAKELAFHANHDELTGLINRRQFEERLGHCLTSLKTKNADYALFYMDLDQFKVINDTCGHQAGDELLCLLTALIKSRLRERDTFGRLGGDEFGILLEHCPHEKAFQIANDIRELVEGFRFPWENQVFSLGISIGMVNLMDVWDVEGVDLLKLADTACYAAKDAGRNRVHLYQAEDWDIKQRQGEMNWVSQITRALEENRFEFYFQPIVSIQKKAPAGLELLLRMCCDKMGGTVLPGAFLPAAERYGLSQKIDRWVVEHALNFFVENPALLDDLSYCSINISGNSVGSDEFLRFVQAQFIEKGVPYDKIAFEVTETAAILNLERATQFIQQMKNLGCTFLLDDFGSGMSSFTYLKQLPVNKLKIDGTFVRDIVDDEIDRAMVRSINDVGHAVGMQTVAEFVENEEIIRLLVTMGVDYAQGYGISKPRPLDELSCELLKETSEQIWRAVNSEAAEALEG